MPKGSRRADKRPVPSRSRRRRSRRSAVQDGEGVGKNVALVRDAVVRTVLAPLNAVLLTRRALEDTVDDAVRRGRMTRDDAQHLVQTLLQQGAKQTDAFLGDLERLLGRGREVGQPARRSSGKKRTGTATLPIADYDELSAAAVQERLQDLSPAELRRVRDYERRHANRKTVLDPIERKLR